MGKTFSKSVYRMTIRRYWAGSALLALMGAMFSLTYANNYSWGSKLISSGVLMSTSFVAAGAAVVCALLVFSYMQDRRAVVMMHSLPVRREAHFLSVFLGGLTLLWTSILLTALELLVIHVGGWGSVHPSLPAWLGLMLLISLAAYSLAVFAGFLTGSVPAQFVITALLLALPVFLELFFYEQCRNFLFGYNGYSAVPLNEAAHPGAAAIKLLGDARGWIVNNAYQSGSFDGKDAGNLLILLGYIAVFFTGSFLLCRVRKLEVAGDFIAVRGMRPVFRYGSAFLSAYFFGSFGKSLYQYTTSAQIIFALFGGALGFFIAEMFVRKTVKVWKHWKGAALFSGAYLLLFILLMVDFTGYGRWVPAADQVESIYLSTSSMPQYGSMAYQLKPIPYLFTGEDMDEALAYQKKIVDTKGQLDDKYNNRSSIYLEVRLKNGRTVTRRYDVNLPHDLGDYKTLQEKAKQQDLERLRNLAKNARYVYFSDIAVMSPDGTSYDTVRTDAPDKAETAELFAALELDNAVISRWSMHFTDYSNFYQYYDESYLSTAPKAWLNSMMTLYVAAGFDTDVPVSIFRDDQNTVAWLLDKGFITQAMLDDWYVSIDYQ